MFKLFKGKKKELVSPAKGRIIPMDQVEDEVFAAKMMGDGFAVIPEEGAIVSPCNGVVVNVFKTKHAVIIRDEFGLELILHVGLDTVKLKGEGFDVKVTENQQVKKGDLLLNVDLAFLKEQNISAVTPVVITNMAIIKSLDVTTGDVDAGDVVLTFESN